MAKIIGNTTATPLIPPDMSGIETTFKRTKYYGDADIIPTCSSLFSYTLNDDGQSYTIAGGEAPPSSEIVIPYEHNGLPITAIGSFSSLTFSEIILPKCIVEIKDDAFFNCMSLSKLVIPDGVTYIGANSFYNSSITEIKIPESVKEIGATAFALCNNLQNVYIGNGIERRGADIFYSCGDLNVYFTGSKSEWKLPTEYEMTNMIIHYDWVPVMKGEIFSVYAQKEDIGDRSTLHSHPNDDLVTAINNAWNNAESATMNANTALSDARIAIGLADTAMNIAKGANQSVSFNDYATMIGFLNGLPSSELQYNRGQNILIVTLNVPDLWVMDVVGVNEPYTYTSDADFISELTSNGYVRVGCYMLAALETQKVDLTEYVTKEEFGSVETALDTIISIQNTLIGGGSV